jgi:hypothetical protein
MLIHPLDLKQFSQSVSEKLAFHFEWLEKSYETNGGTRIEPQTNSKWS